MKTSTRNACRLTLAGLLAITLGHAKTFAQQANPYPHFSLGNAYNNNGVGPAWAGGDSPFGIYSPDGSFSLWTFRDTFLTPPGASGRVTPIVGNTLARVPYSTSNFSPTYYYGANTSAHPSTPSSPQPFFECNYSGCRYWPNKAFFLTNTQNNNNLELYVILSIIDPAISGSNQNAGTDIARITNPLADPSVWNIYYSTLTIDQTVNTADAIWFGTEALTTFYQPNDSSTYALSQFQGNSVLMYGYCVTQGVPIAIMVPYTLLFNITGTTNQTFIPPSTIQRLASSSGNPVWTPYIYNPAGTADYYDINRNNPTGGLGSFGGYSIRYNSNLGLWQMISVAGNGGSAQYFVPAQPGVSDNTTAPATGPIQPSIWLATSALGPYSTKTTLNYSFSVVNPNSSLNQQMQQMNPSFPVDTWQSTTCYGLREWQLTPGVEHDASLFFTFTYGSTIPNVNTVDDSMYQTGFGGLPNPYNNSGGIDEGIKPRSNKAAGTPRSRTPGASKALKIPN